MSLTLRQQPTSPLFPYTTLFRSEETAVGMWRIRKRQTGREVFVIPAPVRLFPIRLPGERHRDWEKAVLGLGLQRLRDRKSTRLNSSHTVISYAVFCLKKKIMHLN